MMKEPILYPKTALTELLRPVFQTFSRNQLWLCAKYAFLPKGDLKIPEWVMAIGDVGPDDDLLDALREAADGLDHQPSYVEVMQTVKKMHRVQSCLDQIVCEHPPKPRFGFVRMA
jgi:hypothetical protein